MADARQDETERKYDVTSMAALPTLAGRDGVVATGPAVVHELAAVYFDTAALDLSRRGMTLRRRTGGSDAGWHLKVPAGRDTRTETRLPLGRAVKTVPPALLDPVRALVRDRPLAPIARISTRRHEYALLGQDETVLAVLCDDEVHAERLHGDARARGWREWEVELVDGPRSLLAALEQHLLAAGATPAVAASKLARTLGDAMPLPAPRPSRKTMARASTAQLVRALIAAQVEELHAQDVGARTGRPGSVHHLRIAARRLRSTLTTYRPMIEPGVPEPLRDELRWLGQSLGQARDAQVLRERLITLLGSEPPELVLGSVADRIDHDLGEAYRTGLERARQALNSQRYFRLLDALDELVTAAPLTTGADARARSLVPRLLQRDADRLTRAVRALDRAEGAPAKDLALHEVRKKAKGLRYAAESAIPLFGARAKTLTRAAKGLQDSLGQHQDAVVAREHLRAFAVQAQVSGESSFTFGRLHALEQARADQAERDFHDTWTALPRKKLRSWIQK